jgi:hypothetical protein
MTGAGGSGHVHHQSPSFPLIQPILTFDELRRTHSITPRYLSDLGFGLRAELARPDHDGLALAAGQVRSSSGVYECHVA